MFFKKQNMTMNNKRKANKSKYIICDLKDREKFENTENHKLN